MTGEAGNGQRHEEARAPQVRHGTLHTLGPAPDLVPPEVGASVERVEPGNDADDGVSCEGPRQEQGPEGAGEELGP